MAKTVIGFYPYERAFLLRWTRANPIDSSRLWKLIELCSSLHMVEMKPSHMIKVSSISYSFKKRLLNHLMLRIRRLFRVPFFAANYSYNLRSILFRSYSNLREYFSPLRKPVIGNLFSCFMIF